MKYFKTFESFSKSDKYDLSFNRLCFDLKKAFKNLKKEFKKHGLVFRAEPGNASFTLNHVPFYIQSQGDYGRKLMFIGDTKRLPKKVVDDWMIQSKGFTNVPELVEYFQNNLPEYMSDKLGKIADETGIFETIDLKTLNDNSKSLNFQNLQNQIDKESKVRLMDIVISELHKIGFDATRVDEYYMTVNTIPMFFGINSKDDDTRVLHFRVATEDFPQGVKDAIKKCKEEGDYFRIFPITNVSKLKTFFEKFLPEYLSKPLNKIRDIGILEKIEIDEETRFVDLTDMLREEASRMFYEKIAKILEDNDFECRIEKDNEERFKYVIFINTVPFQMHKSTLELHPSSGIPEEVIDVINNWKLPRLSSVEEIIEFFNNKLPTFVKKLNKARDIGIL